MVFPYVYILCKAFPKTSKKIKLSPARIGARKKLENCLGTLKARHWYPYDVLVLNGMNATTTVLHSTYTYDGQYRMQRHRGR